METTAGKTKVSAIRIVAENTTAKLAAAINATYITAGIQATLIKAAALTGQFLKLMFLDDAFLVSDQTAFVLQRQLEELGQIADEALIAYSKPVDDAAAVSDVYAAQVVKALGETLGFSDLVIKEFDKAVNEPVAITDPMAIKLTTSRADSFGVGEGGPGHSDYAIDYGPDDYAWSYGPAVLVAKPRSDSAGFTDSQLRMVNKGINDPVGLSETISRYIRRQLTDQVFATDDFLGAANLDDDEVMTLLKGFGDRVNLGDSFAYVAYFVRQPVETVLLADSITSFLRKTLSDAAAATDQATIRSSKTLADASNATDVATKSTNKTASDASNATDTTIKSLNKSLADSGALSDAAVRKLSRSVADSSAFSDAPAISLSRALADSAGTTDQTTLKVGAAKSDAASMTDSGVALVQSYVNSFYFASDYVGSKFTF